jgi:hypothetical protein
LKAISAVVKYFLVELVAATAPLIMAVKIPVTAALNQASEALTLAAAVVIPGLAKENEKVDKFVTSAALSAIWE